MRRSALRALDDPEAAFGDLWALPLGALTCGKIYAQWQGGGAAEDLDAASAVAHALQAHEALAPGTLRALAEIEARLDAVARVWALATREAAPLDRVQAVVGGLAAAARFALEYEAVRSHDRRPLPSPTADRSRDAAREAEAAAVLAAARGWLRQLDGLDAPMPAAEAAALQATR